MRLQLLLRDSLQAELGAIFRAADLTQAPSALAEMVRAELLALRVSARHILAERVAARLAPAGGVTPDQVLALLGMLEEVDDVTSGPAGRLAAAPLRVVRLAAGRYLVLGTVPTHLLAAELPALRIAAAPGVLRRAWASGDVQVEEEVEVQMRRVGGRVLDGARWAGDAPRADEAWLAELDMRSGDLRLDGMDTPMWSSPSSEWQRYAPRAQVPEQHRRWRHVEKEEGTGLLRARQPGGYHAYAWATKGESGALRLLPLRRDEARRTMFALDAASGAPVELVGRRQGDAVVLEVGVALPLAEYRYLLACGERLNWEGFPVRYRMTAADFAGAAAHLRQQLQVRLEEAEA